MNDVPISLEDAAEILSAPMPSPYSDWYFEGPESAPSISKQSCRPLRRTSCDGTSPSCKQSAVSSDKWRCNTVASTSYDQGRCKKLPESKHLPNGSPESITSDVPDSFVPYMLDAVLPTADNLTSLEDAEWKLEYVCTSVQLYMIGAGPHLHLWLEQWQEALAAFLFRECSNLTLAEMMWAKSLKAKHKDLSANECSASSYITSFGSEDAALASTSDSTAQVSRSGSVPSLSSDEGSRGPSMDVQTPGTLAVTPEWGSASTMSLHWYDARTE
ncbi:hypothetical protein LTR56_012307 [Elasticomyces elasticus]|nr:hypothetical protein LTR56_012307 [Elasticomyces elasticus]KAK3641263.1 hypothetical protein LTR22_016631 [Elasticomyces elasticus]KAK4922592.1 hypothetical protein LTR49_010119 [Elasticomyces elasticus]KAK5760765.1 hypothetical protein LTS12_009123 [Elasticomyces elasticus]